MNKLFKSTLCTVSAAAMLVTSAITGFSTSVRASAASVNVPQSLQTELTELQSIRKKALQEYDYYAKRKCTVKSAIPADFKVLFVEAKNVKTRNGNIASTTKRDDEIFSKIPEQFEQVVEYISDYNVNIITDTLIVNDVVTATSNYILAENIQPWINEYAPLGGYDSVFVYNTEDPSQTNSNDFGNPCSSIPTRDNAFGYSYVWSPISCVDYNANTNKHYYSVDIAIHEWIHTLESFRNIDGRTVLMPSADIKNLDKITLNSNKTEYTNGYYKWANDWPTDERSGKSLEFYKGIEEKNLAYGRAFLTGRLYDMNNFRYVGMFPSFWKLFSGKTFLGEFYAQDTSGKYAAFLGSDTQKTSYVNAPATNKADYVWKLCYSYKDNKLHVVSKKFPNWNYPLENTPLSNHKFTKINFDDSDTYYIYNKAENKYLSYNTTANSHGLSGFSTADTLQWNIKYIGNNAFEISPKSNSNLLFDVKNAANVENNSISLHGRTGYTNAQSFQFRLNADDTYSIYPMLSNTRCLNASGTKLTITTAANKNSQKWVITKANGNKEIFPGKYTIKNSDGGFINAGSSNTLSLNANTPSATKWNIKAYPGKINAKNFYLLQAANGRVLDLLNTYDIEGNKIIAHPNLTGYATGQAWQFVLGVDSAGEYYLNIVPLNTRTRGLNVTNNTVSLKSTISKITLARA